MLFLRGPSANIGPTWPQLGPILASKIGPTGVQEPSKMHSNLHLSFDTVFDRFLVDFGSNLDLKTTPKSIQKSFLKLLNKLTTKIAKMLFSYYVFTIFTYFGSLNMCCKTVKNVSNIHPKIASKTMFQFASVLDPTWLHFGRVLAPKLEPSWHQNALKIDPRTYQKKNAF